VVKAYYLPADRAGQPADHSSRQEPEDPSLFGEDTKKLRGRFARPPFAFFESDF
jgi:hypothetical protein